jgi:UDP-GlcNAc:undecaprenyl-phosphate GlcNAc-1-phosphate transferase
MALSVPLLDAAASIARRFLRRQRIFTPDRNHVHHRLLDRGFSPRKVALILYGVCGLAAAFSLIQTVPGNRLNGLVLVLFCAAVWIGIQSAGYLEFEAAGRLALSGTFRQIVNAGILLETFERRLTEASSHEDSWQAVRSVGQEFGCTHVRMSLAGKVYEDSSPATAPSEHCCSIRIPLDADGYVNFRYPAGRPAQYTVAIGAIGEILQRSLSLDEVRRRGAEVANVSVSRVPPRSGKTVSSSI